MDNLTEEQIAELMEAFSLFDKEDKGYIQISDIVLMMGSLGQAPTENDVKEMLGNIPSEFGPGTVDFPNFLHLMVAKMTKKNSEEELKAAFRVFDSDGVGWVSTEELRHIMKVLGEKLTDAEVEDMIKQADQDGDGTVNYEEFCRMMSTSKDD